MGRCEGNPYPTLQTFITGIDTPFAEGGTAFLRRTFLRFFFMDFSLLSPLEFFVVPKNGDGRNNKPPAMRVRVDCYTKKLPFRLQ